MDGRFLKPYDPTETEDRIYALWEKSGFFSIPTSCPNATRRRTFSIILPPPNVTGTLHMGHAAMLAIEDIMIRYKRIKGFRTLWLPGTDHAAIATQSKVEKDILKKEKKHRQDLGREELLKRVDIFAKESHDTIVNQMRKMGASVDWSREAFTLDDKRSLAVRTTFKKMYDLGLIYRGNRIVNWDPKGQTTISDDEIVYIEEKVKFYYFKYGPFTIGTARPETKFGDKYVVMHPLDKRYDMYKHGQKLDLEWINGPITATVIKDESVDMEFGTGAMTITPWHSAVDFDIAERHKLDKEQIIDKYGRLLPVAGEFAGMKIAEARPKIVEKLRAKGLVAKEEDYVHNLATAERTGGVIEPQVMKQWFMAVDKPFEWRPAKGGALVGLLEKSKKMQSDAKTVTLKDLMKYAVESGAVKIVPERFEKIYFHWIENLRDWCISRQIWYGHRVPVWYKGDEAFIDIEAPRGEGWIQDEDTLDTWFSSGLWTFSTLGWPENTEDLKIFHPTSVLETGYDILFFWVARMILMTGCLLGDVPFRSVYLHGLVRDGKGRKMSKSLDNVIDPLDMIKKYGADATRLSLIIGTGPGNDMKLSEDKVRGYKLFSNKLWNIARFVFSSTDGIKYSEDFKDYTKADTKILNEFQALLADITTDIEGFRYYLAGEKLYHYAWHRFADEIIEESKPVLKSNDAKSSASRAQLLVRVLDGLLRALHPFIPYITEEIWSQMPVVKGKNDLILVAKWPI